jgi:membrane-associated phospholipid phosphatase
VHAPIPPALSLAVSTVLIPGGVFAVLAEEVREGENLAWDHPILHSLYDFHDLPLSTLMDLVTDTGGLPWFNVLVAFAALALVAVARRGVADAVFLLLTVVSAEQLVQLLKQFFDRPRPALAESALTTPHTSSFPSGHASNAMALTAALLVLLWSTRWRWPVVGSGAVYVLAVGVSRIYLGVHFPSDVVAGWCFGLAWVGALALLRSAARGELIRFRQLPSG